MKKVTFRSTLKAIRKSSKANRDLLYSTLQKPREGFVVEAETNRHLHWAFQTLDAVDETLERALASLSVGP